MKKSEKRIVSKKITILFFILLFYPLCKSITNRIFSAEVNVSELGSRPKDTRSILKNSIYTVEYFLGKTLPNYLLDVQLIDAWDTPKLLKRKNDKDEDINIVFILGESLTPNHMSLYGYHRKTTPYLDKLNVESKSLMKLRGIAAGVFTDTAIPSLFNLAQKPNAVSYILQNRNNLFKLAKENGFKTHFFTATHRLSFNYIRSYLGHQKSIDNYIDPSHRGYDVFTTKLDQFLVDELKKVDLKGKNFIVLSMNGSHEPYKFKYPKEFDVWQADSLTNQYDNSVLYTDHIINKINEHLAQSKKKTIVVFTSDHGQHLGDDIGYGKGNLELAEDYEVPVFFTLHNNDDYPEKIKQILSDEEWLSHYEFGNIIAYLLGYDSLHNINQKPRLFYVLGGELNGNSGYAKIVYDHSGDQIKFTPELFY